MVVEFKNLPLSYSSPAYYQAGLNHNSEINDRLQCDLEVGPHRYMVGNFYLYCACVAITSRHLMASNISLFTSNSKHLIAIYYGSLSHIEKSFILLDGAYHTGCL